MADQQDPEAEIAEIEREMSAPDPAIEALRKTDPDEANAQEMARLRRANERLLAQRRGANLRESKAKILAEFPLAPESLVVGSSTAEMRRVAEALHTHIGAAVSKGIEAAKGAAAGGGDGATATVADKSKEWGAPPASSVETASATPQAEAEWQDLKAKARMASTPEEKRAIIGDIRQKGVRLIPQQTFQMRVRGAEERRASGEAVGRT